MKKIVVLSMMLLLASACGSSNNNNSAPDPMSGIPSDLAYTPPPSSPLTSDQEKAFKQDLQDMDVTAAPTDAMGSNSNATTSFSFGGGSPVAVNPSPERRALTDKVKQVCNVTVPTGSDADFSNVSVGSVVNSNSHGAISGTDCPISYTQDSQASYKINMWDQNSNSKQMDISGAVNSALNFTNNADTYGFTSSTSRGNFSGRMGAAGSSSLKAEVKFNFSGNAVRVGGATIQEAGNGDMLMVVDQGSNTANVIFVMYATTKTDDYTAVLSVKMTSSQSGVASVQGNLNGRDLSQAEITELLSKTSVSPGIPVSGSKM